LKLIVVGEGSICYSFNALKGCDLIVLTEIHVWLHEELKYPRV